MNKLSLSKKIFPQEINFLIKYFLAIKISVTTLDKFTQKVKKNSTINQTKNVRPLISKLKVKKNSRIRKLTTFTMTTFLKTSTIKAQKIYLAKKDFQTKTYYKKAKELKMKFTSQVNR